MKKIRLGIIGCGSMMKNHVAGVQNLENVELTAFADVVLDRAQYLAEDWPGAYVTTDYTTVLDHVDAVLVALPHDLHYSCGMFFARQGKHILMEKPLCNTEEECLRLIETCEEEGVVLMCGYPIRYWPAMHFLKEQVDSGKYGRIMQMSLWTEQLTQLEDTGLAGLRQKLLEGVPLKASDRFDGGFRIAVNNGSAYYDYSAESVVDMLANYLSPRVAQLMKEA